MLVNFEACGSNNTDIWARKAAYGDDDSGWKGDFDFPTIYNVEVTGEIVEVRSNVSEDRIDERVLINYSLYAEATMEFQSFAEADLIGSERGEGYAEHAALLAESTNPIDRSLSVPELATFPAAYVTDGCLMRRKWTPMTMYSSQAPPTVPGRDLFNSQSNAMHVCS
jgi:NADPH:quinone reductase-like Zn-dependent oxidoreductase